MNLPCNIIQDLLPLYHDHVCSDETAELIEEHLSTCESCQKILKSMDTEIIVPKQDIQSIDILKNIKKQLKTKEMRGLLIAIALLFAIICFYYFTHFRLHTTPTKNMNVGEVAVLSDNSIGFHLKMDQNKYFLGAGIIQNSPENTVLYITPLSQIIPDRRFSLEECYFFCDFENRIVYSSYGEIHEFLGDVKKIYLGSDEKDRILIWEEDMEVPSASSKMEAEKARGPF